METNRTVLCVNADGSYVVFIDSGIGDIRYDKHAGRWWQYGTQQYKFGVTIPEACFATNYADIKPGEGVIPLV
jgi:hypothetical protein